MWLYKSTFHKKFKISFCNIHIKTKCSIKCKEVNGSWGCNLLLQLPKENLKNLGLPGFKPWLALQQWCSALTNWASKPAGIIPLCNYVKILLKRFHFNGHTIRFLTDSKDSQDSKYSLWLWNCKVVMVIHVYGNRKITLIKLSSCCLKLNHSISLNVSNQAWEILWGLNSQGLSPISEVHISFSIIFKHKISQFHIVVVLWWQRNVLRSVKHCKFVVYLLKLLL